MRLRPAVVAELDRLSDLCMRSKAVWGYDEAFMAACRRELTLTAGDLNDTDIQVAEDDDGLCGVAQLSVFGEQACIEKLFVDPEGLGRGVGRRLYDWCVAVARDRGARVLVIEADPDAEAFYLKMGAVRDGQVPSGSIQGRMLPRLTHRV